MINKVFVFLWIALIAILVIENIVWWAYAYVFLDTSSSWWILSLVSAVIWVFIWFWIKWIIVDKKGPYEENDF